MTGSALATRECLHCGETLASIKSQRIVLCGIVGGYETRELVEEFPRHRWASWTDAELDRVGIIPGAYERHRRTPITTFQWVACEDTQRGHAPAGAADVGTFADRIGQCVLCGQQVVPTQGAN